MVSVLMPRETALYVTVGQRRGSTTAGVTWSSTESLSLIPLGSGRLVAGAQGTGFVIASAQAKRDSAVVSVRDSADALLSDVRAVSAGMSESCAVLNSGALVCWGTNESGQIGIGARFSLRPIGAAVSVQSDRSFATVSVGSRHACAIDVFSHLYCWGINDVGQATGAKSSPVLSPQRVAIGSFGFRMVSVGGDATCALTESRDVYCWGIFAEGTSPRLVTLPSAALGVSTGARHACALLTTGRVMCWGANGDGQLGGPGLNGSFSSPVDVPGLLGPALSVTAGSFHSCAVLQDGSAMCWGENIDGQLGAGDFSASAPPRLVGRLDSSIRSIEAGGQHTCAISVTGTAYCWGSNLRGTLGDGSDGATASDFRRATPARVAGSVAFRSISAGSGSHTCATTNSGHAMCWGSNQSMNLGGLPWTAHPDLQAQFTTSPKFVRGPYRLHP
jgi:alpha-tubulin suppressor-like RCC1 family protein